MGEVGEILDFGLRDGFLIESGMTEGADRVDVVDRVDGVDEHGRTGTFWDGWDILGRV